VKDTLDVWPALPLYILCDDKYRVDNVVAVLGHTGSDRVHLIEIPCVGSRHLEKLSAAMEVPFPELKSLVLWKNHDTTMPVLPDSFLGGSAPVLRQLYFRGIPFPGLPKWAFCGEARYERRRRTGSLSERRGRHVTHPFLRATSHPLLFSGSKNLFSLNSPTRQPFLIFIMDR
jgi:hypothetical protein